MSEFKTVIPIPCFSYRIYLIFTDDLKESADKLSKAGQLVMNHGMDESTDAFTVVMPNQSYSYIVLKKKATIQHISHEVYHALCGIFKWIGAKHEEEIFAYFLGYIIEFIIVDQQKAQSTNKVKKVLDKRKKV